MDIILSITTAFLITFSAVPIVIRVFRSMDLLDTPDKRKIHSVSTPSLGGIAIYLGFMVALFFWVPLADLAEFKYLLLAIFFAFLLGVRDDIASLHALDKLTIQIFAALLVVFVADIRFTQLYGVLGLTQLPFGVAEFLSIFTIVVLTNAFNLIDGIDGLAGSIALIALSFFGWWFFETGQSTLGFISVSMSASVLGFLFFNWAPSRIFMGDTGSLVLGFILSVLMMRFIEVNNTIAISSPIKFSAPVAMSVALLILPVYDTLRVFIIRWMSGRSPMSADKNHTHHILIKLGLGHSASTLVLVSFNISAIALAWFLQPLGNNWASLIILVFAISFGGFLDYRLKQKINTLSSHRKNERVRLNVG